MNQQMHKVGAVCCYLHQLATQEGICSMDYH